jgi:excisionase family DNA binding protein
VAASSNESLPGSSWPHLNFVCGQRKTAIVRRGRLRTPTEKVIESWACAQIFGVYLVGPCLAPRWREAQEGSQAAMTHMLLDPNGRVEPVPYSIDEFAEETGCGRRAVLRMIADGDLKTITVGADERIPASELRRILVEDLDRKEGFRLGLALALKDGLIREVGLDQRGSVVYERTDVPLARRRG